MFIFTLEKIKEKFLKYGYIVLDENYISTNQKMTIKDSDGYLYFINFSKIRNGRIPDICSIYNPYSVENIKTWIKNNNCDYSFYSGEYTGSKNSTIILKCSFCNSDWHTSWSNMLDGYRCPFCFGSMVNETNCLGLFNSELEKEWSEENEKSFSQMRLGSNYDAIWKCSKCGRKWQAKVKHRVKGISECPKCGKSLGEKRIIKFLESRSVEYNTQYKIKNCRNVLPLVFDFAIFKKEGEIFFLCEYDGEQHFKSIRFGGVSSEKAKEEFEKTKIRDSIKTKYCQENGIKLIRIPYWEFDNIENILSNELLTY